MLRRLSLVLLALWFGVVFAYPESDEYSRIARVSYLDGHVSFQHAGDVDWSSASVNMALQPADRIYTGTDGRAEIEFDDGSVLRMAEKTDIELLSMRDGLIQVRMLVGLSTLTVQSGIDFEINTPAAAFNVLKKGIYRFDVAENGDSDGIVRKGTLEAASNNFTRRAESGELIHATPGEQGTNVLSRYDGRDEWDEWNDRRNAELNAYKSRQYIPDHVSMGVRDLDAYGHWVDVDYGPAWVPYQVASGWSPYWEGRWVYRPLWGWTWVSYEPWGWLPYHYGRWYQDASFGWCWLPGASFGFNFWSPGLVRFYYGPSWVSWLPLGPGDYYNVNNFYYHRNYAYQLNSLRLLQRRSPDDLFNRHIGGAFRTARTDQFLNDSFGSRSRITAVPGVSEPWRNGRMVTDRLALAPGARSYAPVPDRQAVRPDGGTRAVIVRSEPSVRPTASDRFLRITNPAVGSFPGAGSGLRDSSGSGVSGTGSPVRVITSPGAQQGGATGGGTSIWNRRSDDGATRTAPGNQVDPAARNPRTEGYRSFGRDLPNDPSRQPGSGMRRMESPSQSPAVRRDSSPAITRPDPAPRRMDSPSVPAPRMTPPPVQERREPERPQQDRRRPSADLGQSSNYATNYTPRTYTPRPESRSYDGGMERFSQAERWQAPARAVERYAAPARQYTSPSWSRGDSGGRAYSPPAASAPPARAPSTGFGGWGTRSGGSPSFASPGGRGQGSIHGRRDR